MKMFDMKDVMISILKDISKKMWEEEFIWFGKSLLWFFWEELLKRRIRVVLFVLFRNLFNLFIIGSVILSSLFL